MTYLLGIDLGTTRTSAAVAHPGSRGDIEIVNLGARSSAVPSVFYAGADGSVLIGEAAERRALTDPSRVVREFKRRIGDPTPLVVAGVPWSPQELSARVVRWVVDRAAEREGGAAARIAVTHPASWGALKKELLGGALAGQGLQVSFLAEPQAAALHYASTERLGPGSTIAVYDLGGGTFDAAVVHKAHSHHEANGFGLLGRPEGIERLGGVDFDQVVFDHVRAGMPEAFADLDDTDPSVLSAVAGVRRECSEAKEALSSDTEVSIPVLLPGAQGSVRLHRSEFEAMIRPQIEDTVAALRRAVGSAGLSPEQLTAVLLVGGSSRIPLVAQLVSEQLGRPVAVDADPKNAIAMGAALSLDPVASTGTGAHVPAPRMGGPGGPFANGRPGTAPVGAVLGAAGTGAAALGRAGSGATGSGAAALGGAALGGAALGGAALGGAALGRAGSGATGSGAAALGGAALGGAGSGVAGSGAAVLGTAGARGPSSTGSAGMRPPGPPAPRTPVMSGGGPRVVPPPRPAPPGYADRPARDSDIAEYDYERPEPPQRRSPALFVTVGGIIAAVAVVGTVLLVPEQQRSASVNTQPDLPVAPLETNLPVSPTPAAEPAPTEDSDPGRPVVPPRSEAPVTTAPVDPPAPTTTVPVEPTPTTIPPTPTTPPQPSGEPSGEPPPPPGPGGEVQPD